jgi:YidC/Oxa1 family membrane protein insertase
MEILQTIFVDPFLNVLIGLRNIMPGQDLGLAIIALTLLVRLILYPLSAKQIRSQRAMQELQPRINEIREQHKGDKEAQSKALLEFYKKNKISPLSSCGPLVLQLAFIYPLFFVFQLAISGQDFGARLYPFIAHPPVPLDATLLGFLDLTQTHNIALAVLTGAAQFIQSWMLVRRNKKTKPAGAKEDASAAISRNMTFIFPLITGYFAYSFPSGLALYWFASTIFAIVQQFIIMRSNAATPTAAPHVQGEVEGTVVK